MWYNWDDNVYDSSNIYNDGKDANGTGGDDYNDKDNIDNDHKNNSHSNGDASKSNSNHDIENINNSNIINNDNVNDNVGNKDQWTIVTTVTIRIMNLTRNHNILKNEGSNNKDDYRILRIVDQTKW